MGVVLIYTLTILVYLFFLTLNRQTGCCQEVVTNGLIYTAEIFHFHSDLPIINTPPNPSPVPGDVICVRGDKSLVFSNHRGTSETVT